MYRYYTKLNIDDLSFHLSKSIIPYIKEIILCHENKSDIDEIKPEYIEGLTFHYVKEMSEVIDAALTNQMVKNPKKL